MNPRPIYHGIDLVRLLAFFCIVSFHDYSTFIYVPFVPERWVGTPMVLMEFLPRVFPFSGMIVVAVFAFLAGLRQGPIPLRRPFLFVVPGLLLLVFAYSDLARRAWFLEWDVYHYLVITLLSLAWFSRERRRTFLFGAIGALFLLFPLWDWFPAQGLPLPLRHALVGVCGDGRGGWFLLPWIGLPWVFLALGRLVGERPRLERTELRFWAPALLFGVAAWGRYFSVDIGPGYYCYIFRQPPWVFWGNMLWFAFFLRASVDPRVQERLARVRLVRAVSHLALSRTFGLAYLLQLAWFAAGEAWLLPALGPRASFYAGYLLILPLTELSTRAVLLVRKGLQRPRT